jgi:hypothetical protein
MEDRVRDDPDDHQFRMTGLRLLGRAAVGTFWPLVVFLVLSWHWLAGPMFVLCLALFLARADDWIDAVHMAVEPARWRAGEH